MRTKATYYAAKADGICVHCCRREAMPGGALCGYCAERNQVSKQARQELRKASGLCPRCGQVPDVGYVRCAACRAYRRAWDLNAKRKLDFAKAEAALSDYLERAV